MSAGDGSYFQCPHCHKRYAASVKARAADGKRIRCRECHEPFTLTIVAGARVKVARQQPSASVAKPAPRQQEKAPLPQKKNATKEAVRQRASTRRSSIQWGTVLLMVLMVVGGGVWWFQDGNQQVAMEISSSADPYASSGLTVDDTALPTAEEVKRVTQEVATPDPSTLNFVASSACRDVAAAQWLNDYTLTHTRFRQSEFVRLLDESVSLTAQMRKQCKNDKLLLSVIESAKLGKKPVWLAPLINTLINPEYDSSKIVDDEEF
ncbi:MAG: hypothetical protein Q9M13_05965 [Mariprofundales bacterium]|nr:hypothetical protein [Mariprofundales bacterium]